MGSKLLNSGQSWVLQYLGEFPGHTDVLQMMIRFQQLRSNGKLESEGAVHGYVPNDQAVAISVSLSETLAGSLFLPLLIVLRVSVVAG